MLIFSLLFACCIGGVISASAADFEPAEGTMYLIKCKGDSKYAIWNSSCVKGTNNDGIDASLVILSNWANYDYRSFFIISGNSTDGYTIRAAKDNTQYVYAITTGDTNGNVGVKSIAEGETVGDECLWNITEQGDGWNIIPKNGNYSWNNRGTNGGNGHIGMCNDQNSNKNANNVWYFQVAGDVVADEAASGYKYTCGTTVGQISEQYKTDLTAKAQAFKSSPTEANYNAYLTVRNAPQNYINLESRYYRIVNADNESSNTTYNSLLFSDMLHSYGQWWNHVNNTTLGNVPEDADKGKNCYIWKVIRSSFPGAAIQVLNGQGTCINNGSDQSTLTLGLSNYYNDGLIYFTMGMHLTNQSTYNVNEVKCSNAAATRTNPMFITTWQHTDSKGSAYTFEPVDLSSATAYAVNITGGDASCYVTLNSTGEVAKNGGFFILSSNAIPQNSDFSSTCGVKKGNISISGQTINVTYSVDYDLTLAEAQRVAALSGVGYPTANSSARSELEQAITSAQTGDRSESTAQTLLSALEKYKATTTDITMPEDGKAYTFTLITKDGRKRYLNYENATTGYKLVATPAADNSSYPSTATLVCHKMSDGTYVLLNNDGKYFVNPASDNNATNGTKGYSDTYAQTISDNTYNVAKLTLDKIVNSKFVTATNEQLFGLMSLKGFRNTGNQNGYLIAADGTGAFDKSNAPYCNGAHSSALLIEEVSYPNKVKFNATNGAFTDVDYIATFSAPFATVIPEGVTAYYVKRDGERAMVTAIESEAIPANTGVLLTSTTGDAVYMAPAANETAATIESNDLGHSAGAEKTLAAGDGYILGNGSKGVAFYKTQAGTLPMNKAYLLASDADATPASIQMVFGGAVDGIADAIALPAGSNAPMYDLTGRRVLRPAKGGVYIQNGQKRIMK